MTLGEITSGGSSQGGSGLALPHRRPMPRRALLAAVALAGCATEGEPELAMPTTAPPPRPDPELAMLRGGAPTLAIGGQTLEVAPLRRFYARHGYRPVWASRDAQATALSEAVLAAAGHGLDPELFHAALLRRQAELPPLERELVLSAAVLSLADALAHGQVGAARRRPVEALATEPADLDAALDAAMDSDEPRRAIEGLAPATPGYAALRAALAREGAATTDQARARRRTLEVNLERQRWLPRQLPPERIWVNVADQQLTFFRDNRPALSCRVVVGGEGEREQSPEFQATVEGTFFNPPWIVPSDIVERDILPRLREDPGYLERRNMVLRENGEIEQRAGAGAGLGYLLFDMPNRFDVFLHDTPARHFFGRDARRLSYGCIRVEKPRELAALVMRRPIEAIHAEVAKGVTHRQELPTPVPVFITYQTAFADEEGRVQFRPDFYRRDVRLSQQLRSRAASPRSEAA